VFEKTFGRKVVDHADVGRLDLEYEAFSVPGSDGQMLIVYTAEPRSATAARLQELAVLVRKSSAPARA
jgi:MmyB-like transcription regulator ligand binding domain